MMYEDINYAQFDDFIVDRYGDEADDGEQELDDFISRMNEESE